MPTNLLEGFGDWLYSIGLDPKYDAEQHVILANIILKPEDGGEPVKYPHMTLFKVLKIDPNRRWARITDATFADPNNPKLADMPLAVTPTRNAGKVYLVQGDEFDKMIKPQISAQGAPVI